MQTIAVLNQKGGVGKTTTVVNLGAALGSLGQRVLVMDLDPQSHLTLHLGLETGGDAPSMYRVLLDGTPLEQAIVPAGENLFAVGSHIDLAAAEMELVSMVGREVLLRDALQGNQDRFDLCLIDCPPSLGLLTLNALAAAQEVIIPLQAHFLALQGFGKLLETIALVWQRINPQLKVGGVLLCMYESGTRLSGEVVSDLESFLGKAREKDLPWSQTRIFRTVIRRNVRLAESPGYGQAIFDYAPGCHGAKDYASLAREVLGLLPGDSGVPGGVGSVAPARAGADRSSAKAQACGRGAGSPAEAGDAPEPVPGAASQKTNGPGASGARPCSPTDQSTQPRADGADALLSA